VQQCENELLARQPYVCEVQHELDVMTYCEQGMEKHGSPSGEFIAHTHTTEGWKITLEDPNACKCNGMKYSQYIHHINGRPLQDAEFVDVPISSFEDCEVPPRPVNVIQGMEEILRQLDHYFAKRGITQQDVDTKVQEIMRMLLHVYETFALSMRFLARAQDWADIWSVFLNAFKLVTGKTSLELVPELVKAKEWIIAFAQEMDWIPQNNDVQGLLEDVSTLREGFETYKKIKKNLVLKHSSKLIKYCLSFGLFTKLGLTFENLKYTEVEQAYIKLKYSSRMNFVEETIEGVLFFLERSAQALELKSWTPFLYNGTTVCAWTEEAFEAKNHYRMYEANNNPEITYSSVLGELNSLIERGEHLCKMPTADVVAKATAKRLLLDLQFIYCEMTATHRNQQVRSAPFAELICGKSCVAKTLFTDMLCAHYARVNKLPEGEEYTYHRNPGEEHWNGYRPHMHTLVYDDIGAPNPKKVMGVDPAIGELLPVINSNAMGANMADLKDKGHCPIRPAHVIVNTNIEHLHADVYYAFPLALRRRLPYIITVEPRTDESQGIDYRQEKSPTFVDTTKLPEVMPGFYPNQWNISVKHVIAKEVPGNGPPQVDFDQEHHFNDIYVFLHWYNQILEEHKHSSMKMERTLNAMHSDQWRELWCQHNLPRQHCQICDYENQLQGPLEDDQDEYYSASEEEEAEPLIAWDPIQRAGRDAEVWFPEDNGTLIGLIHDGTYASVHLIDDWITRIRKGTANLVDIVNKKLRAVVLSKMKHLAIAYMKDAAEACWKKIVDSSPLRWALLVIPAFATLAIVGSWCSSFFAPQEDVQGPASSKYGAPMTAQPQDAEPNPWYNADMKVSSFDVPTLTSSWKGKTMDELRSLLAPNIIAFSLRGEKGGEEVCSFEQLHALCLGGHLYVTNNHLIPLVDTYRLHIVHGTDERGVNINKDETLGPSNWKRYPDRDLVFFELHIPPRQDLRALVPRETLNVRCEGAYIQRDIKGFVETNVVRAVQVGLRVHPRLSAQPLNLWIGQAATKTVNGDCGSVLVGLTAFGPLLLGLHVAGGVTSEVECIQLDQRIIEEASAHFGTPIISCNTVNLAAKDKLLPLHSKSIFRFMEGHAKVMGSLPTRASMRSKVAETILAPALKKRGLVVKHGPPVMKGWQPWNHAIQPVLAHSGRIRNDILRQAADAYLEDIFREIPKEEFESLQVLDDLEAINGVPGVKYLEGLNRSSSLGYPWQRSKKFMLMDIEDSRWQDGVTFKQEVWDEIDRMVKDYESGRVTNPVFVGQLKDEAIEFRKIIIGKTRVFLISSAAWTLIMRKWYLSFIRLFQRYRFVFEGMPGLRTQSAAWGKLRKYLTEFGLDRLFAGDFSQYDKLIEAITSLEGFRIIYEVCKYAGWDALSLQILWAIAEDASFPTVLVNGDLVQLEGSNPSGQAVTVILNCIVNSLYMRYAYILRNPEQEAKSFKKNVHLATYGDDNAGNVSKKIDWFHHTAIQEELADIGIKYTMADKSSESRPFISIDEVEFLKRTWRYEPEVDDYFAPLNEASIEKRLMVGVQSAELTPEWQAVENMATSMEDYFFYGRETFEEKKKFLIEVGLESGLQFHMAAKKWPQFDDLLERWKSAPSEISAEQDSSRL